MLLLLGSILLTYRSKKESIPEIKIPNLPPYVFYTMMWIITYGIILYVWIEFNRRVNWPAFNVLVLINLILNFLWVYVFFTLQDPRISFIIGILLLSSTIGIIIQVWSQPALRNILFINVAWLILLVFTNYRINSFTKKTPQF